ncbi:hypothetical protein FMEXI_10336 [Fusarium mexicanum]|uniref:Uncharacterized protein n=1 Tax=Fusarium mexicanum TaxID=751941 RepID=A0A8H5IIA0_9HYPO|nr:hypothetical protein FMEXI_10336 [Fusarium mexicanum]
MSSDHFHSALNGGDNCISPTTNLQSGSVEYMKVEAMMRRIMDSISGQFHSMNDRISELKAEVGEISAGKTMSSLASINERLSYFNDVNARFNETDMLDHGNIKAFDVFNGRLLNIEEEIKLLKHSIQGTAEESDESIKCYLSKIDERIVNLEGNLHRLEDRMFANLDGAIDDETGFITLVVDPVDFQKLDAMNPTEIAQKLREKGSGWKIENIKLKPPKTADQKPQVLINFLTRDSEKHMRDHISEMSELFGLEHGVFCLSPVYTLHVEHLVPHLGKKNNMGDKELEEALLKALGIKDLKAKVTYERMLLKTQSFDVVSRLCMTGVKLLDHYYEIVCWKTGHFKEDCTVSVMVCGRCSGTHDTRGCKAASRCCNCKGPHTTWSPECDNVLAKVEHRNSAWYRRLSPHWAKHLPKAGKPTVPTVTKSKAGKAKAADSSPTTSGEQSGPSSQAAEKRAVGRPKTLPVKESGQQTLGQFLKTAGNGQSPTLVKEPSASTDADMTGTDTASLEPIQGTGVANSGTLSSTADVTRSSVSDVDGSPAAMEIDTDTKSLPTPIESQSSGSDGDSLVASMDIDTASTTDNEPVEGQITETEGDAKVGKARGNNKNNNKNKKNKNKNNNHNNNKNNKNNNNNDNNKSKNNKNNNKSNNKNNNNNNSATNEKKTQTSKAHTSTPSSGSGSSQSQVSDKPSGANGKKKGTFKEFLAWKKAQGKAAHATNDPPAPLSNAPDIAPSNTPPDSPVIPVPTLSAQTTSTPAPLPPIPTLSTSSSSTPPATIPPNASTLYAIVSSTSSVPSVPIFTTLHTLSSPAPLSLPSKRGGPLGLPPPEKRRKALGSIENGDGATDAFMGVAMEEHVSES